jgi:hypothetical protein
MPSPLPILNCLAMDGSPDLPHLCVKSFIVHLPIAPHHGSLPQQFGLVWDLLLKADP